MDQKALAKKLSCPVCLEIPLAEVYQCKNGHVICENCSSQVSTCPTCRDCFDREKIRCRLAEDILDGMKFNCKFKKFGCPEKLPRDVLENHADICRLRGLRINICKLFGFTCDFKAWERALHEAGSHFIKKHHVMHIQSESNNIDVFLNGLDASKPTPTPETEWPPTYLDYRNDPPTNYRDVSFLLFTGYNQEDNTVLINVMKMVALDRRTSVFYANRNDDSENVNSTIDFVIKSPNPNELPDMFWSVRPFEVKHAEFALKNLAYRVPYGVLLRYARNNAVTITCSVQVKAPDSTTYTEK